MKSLFRGVSKEIGILGFIITMIFVGVSILYSIYPLITDISDTYRTDGSNPFIALAVTTPLTATVTAGVVAVTVAPSTVAYGTVTLNSTKSTTEVSSTITITNTGNVTENITGISSDAVGGTAWELAATAGATGFTYKFDEGGTPYSWTTFNIDNTSYVDLKLGLTASTTAIMDLQVGTPTASDTSQKTITVTVQASAQ